MISSRAALDMLCTCAPRAWCKRLLNWEVFNGSLDLYATQGEIAHFVTAKQILAEAGLNSVPSEKELAELVGKIDDNALVSIRRAASAEHPFVEIEGYRHEWYEPCSVIPLPFGLVPASTVDWEKGTLSAELLRDMVPNEWLQYPEELFEVGEFETLKISLSGLSFDVAAVEMLVPSASLPNGDAVTVAAAKRLGRPPKWDWDAAMAHVTAIAAQGQLPSGDGAQARLEELIAGYFSTQFGAEPATSDIRKRASRIIQALEGQ